MESIELYLNGRLCGGYKEIVTPSPQGIPALRKIDGMDVSCCYVSAVIDEVDPQKIKSEVTACCFLDALENCLIRGESAR